MSHARGSIAALGLYLLVNALPAATLQVADLFRTPQFARAQLSPDGKRLAAVVASGNTRNLAVIDIDKGTAYAVTAYTRPFEVLDVRWQNDGRLIYTWAQRSPDAIELRMLSSVDADAKNNRQIFPGLIPAAIDFDMFDGVLSCKRKDPTAVLVNLYARSGFSDAVEIYPVEGRRDRLTSAPGPYCKYVLDHMGVVRACINTEEDLSRKMFYRDADHAEWRVLETFAPRAAIHYPIGFTSDNRALNVISDAGRDTTAVYEYDPAKRERGALVFSAPDVDVLGGVVAADGHTLIGARYIDDVQHVHFFDEQQEALRLSLEKSFAGNQVDVVNWSEDGTKALVLVSGTREPGRYFLFDRSTKKLGLVADSMPWIPREPLASAAPVTMKSRDGLMLHGYLTLPPGRAAKALPLIVRTPDALTGTRMMMGWDPVVQFFASRGYGVLDLNPRGSGGYGREFRQRGLGEIGRRIQDDIEDAVADLAGNGVANLHKVCTMGGTYGGYNALMAAARAPAYIRCVVALSAVTDLSSMLEGVLKVANFYRERSRLELAGLRDVFGAPLETDALRARSPIGVASQIRVPVFLAHGYDDFIAPYADAKRLKTTLEQAHVPVEFFESRAEGHGFTFQETKVSLYERIDKFIRQANPPD